ncbi:MAG: helix-turn-helix transcriptional regulator [Bacillota bacterium]|nr:helix-turn-helix transcriptional regulator [Bacillota bacterium]
MSASYTCRYSTIDVIATGKKIESLLRQSDVSVKELANTLGVSNQSVYKWIKGKSLPTLENLFQISHLLQVSMDEIVVEETKYSYALPEIYVREIPEATYIT